MKILVVGIQFIIIAIVIRILFDIPCAGCMDLDWHTLPMIGKGGELYLFGFMSTASLITGIILTIVGLLGLRDRR